MDAYERLAAKLDQGPLGAPRTENLLAILRELFRPEEAALAAQLPFRPAALRKIAEAAGRDASELEPVLEDMASRGLLYARRTDKGPYYALLPVYPGAFELQFMGGQTGPGRTHLARLFESYYSEAMGKAFAEAKTPFARVVSLERRIPSGSEIHPYERVSRLIDEQDTFALGTCYCRHEKSLLGKACSAPKDDMCMVFGAFAQFAIERGFARAATRADMTRTLDRAEEHGLVHVSDNVSGPVSFLCNCCGCCCGFLRTITELGRANVVATSRFVAALEETRCSGCEACVGVCQVGALRAVGGALRLDADRCLGCGACVHRCPSDALRLEARTRYRAPHATRAELNAALRRDRGLTD